ncbi:MAG: hypothetical protein Q9M27_05315 [Mariprofundaceae bacterium]|nr:hypothetical protein [Mariprofundaceae bacterium]
MSPKSGELRKKRNGTEIGGACSSARPEACFIRPDYSRIILHYVLHKATRRFVMTMPDEQFEKAVPPWTNSVGKTFPFQDVVKRKRFAVYPYAQIAALREGVDG